MRLPLANDVLRALHALNPQHLESLKQAMEEAPGSLRLALLVELMARRSRP
jgi:hypothetical protein